MLPLLSLSHYVKLCCIVRFLWMIFKEVYLKIQLFSSEKSYKNANTSCACKIFLFFYCFVEMDCNYVEIDCNFDPLHAKLFSAKNNRFLYFISFLNTDIEQGADFHWHGKQEHAYIVSNTYVALAMHGQQDVELFFSCDQAALQMVFSVCPSVRLSVCPLVRPSHLFDYVPSSYHHEIFMSYYQWQKWRPCKRSRSEVKGQGHRGHNPTLPFPDCNSSLNSVMMMKWCI